MPSHRKHLDLCAGISSSISASSSGSSLHGVHDFSDLKEVVKEVSRRLEVLEKVFLFVDFEQIRELVDKFSKLELAPTTKAGVDSAFSADSPKKSRSKSDCAAGKTKVVPEVCSAKATSPAPSLPQSRSSASISETLQTTPKTPGRLQPLKPYTTGPSKTLHPPGKLQMSRPPCVAAPPADDEIELVADDVGKDAGHAHFNSTGSTHAGEHVSMQSTGMRSCSEWTDDLAESRGSDLIDEERLRNFVKQATRPKFRQPYQGYI